jgi:hypothetical protein
MRKAKSPGSSVDMRKSIRQKLVWTLKRKGLAAFSPSTINHLPAVRGAHSLTETLAAFSNPFRGSRQIFLHQSSPLVKIFLIITQI